MTEFAVVPYAADAPLHVTAVRTAQGKYATYSDWAPGGIAIDSNGQEQELYDYSTPSGRLELHNGAGGGLHDQMDALLTSAIADELREPLPMRLAAAQTAGVHVTTAP